LYGLRGTPVRSSFGGRAQRRVDLTSSYFDAATCPLAKFGYSRDGKPGTLQVNWGLSTDPRGRPTAVSVLEGSSGDPKTLLGQVEKARARHRPAGDDERPRHDLQRADRCHRQAHTSIGSRR
jgi:transposase